MPRPSVADERRSQILEAATRAIADRGFEGVRLADVAEEAGVAVGTIQHYFESRDELLVAAFQADNLRSARAAREAASGEDAPWERIVLLAEWATSLTRWELWLEYWAVAGRRRELREVIADAYEDWRAPVAEAVSDGVAQGAFRSDASPEMVAATFIALADGLAIQQTLGVGCLTIAEVRRILLGAVGALVFP